MTVEEEDEAEAAALIGEEQDEELHAMMMTLLHGCMISPVHLESLHELPLLAPTRPRHQPRPLPQYPQDHRKSGSCPRQSSKDYLARGLMPTS